MTDIRIGCCGYSRYEPGAGWKEEYATKLQAYTDAFGTVELNRTFYELPRPETAEKWRGNALGEFDFCLKAWMAITHPSSSPVWNNHRDELDEQMEGEIGYLAPTEPNFRAWDQTLEVAEGMDASVCLLQCSASFDPTDEHIANMREFLGEINRGGVELAWEPRGDWKGEDELVAELCDELDLIHVVDPMRYRPVSEHDWAYVRLHGLNEDEYDYDYNYTEHELATLAGHLDSIAEERERIYCMFNNDAKFDNARQLAEMLDG